MRRSAVRPGGRGAEVAGNVGFQSVCRLRACRTAMSYNRNRCQGVIYRNRRIERKSVCS